MNLPRPSEAVLQAAAETTPGLRRASLALLLCLFTWLVNSPAQAQGTIGGPNPTNLVAYLNGVCELPANASPYQGTAVLSYDLSTYNALSNTAVTCKVSLPAELAPTDAAIYGPANPEQNGPLLFDLGQPAFTTNLFCVVVWPAGEICSTGVTFGVSKVLSVTPEQMTQLNSGLWYVNVTSGSCPGGEIRGQVAPSGAAVLSSFTIQPPTASSFWVTAQPNTAYTIQSSPDLASWTAVTNVNTSNSVFQVVDPLHSNSPQRFYRAISP